nr:FCD domain-containing protein [Sphingobium jiangsuense]
MSDQTLREVLNRLSAEGFVQQIDQKGFRVPKFSQKKLKDMIRSRCLLNEIIFREAIENATDSTDEAVIVAHFRLSRTPKMLDGSESTLNPEIEVAHRHFHQALIAACGSRWLTDFNDRLFDLTTRYRALVAPRHSKIEEEHRQIMEAVLDRDVERAVTLSNAHITKILDLALESEDDEFRVRV